MTKKAISVILAVIMVLSLITGASAEDGKKNYVVLGDSIAYGSGLSNPRAAVYGKIVADTNGYEYKNFAIPGHTTKNLLSRMTESNVKDAIESADIISISIGGNNFLLGNLNELIVDAIVNNDYSRFVEIAETFAQDLDTIIRTIRDLNPDTAILLQTIYNPQTGYIGEVYQAGADLLNGKMFEYAQENPGEIIIVDVASELTDSGKDFADDGIHPSAEGNEKIARAVLKALYENGLGSETEPVISEKGKDARGTKFMSLFIRIYGSAIHFYSIIKAVFSSLFA